MNKDTWKLDFKTFSEKVKAIRSLQYCDDYYRHGIRHQIGCHYYLYVDENLNIINPYTKKDSGKKILKSFVSTSSREDVLRQAYNWIIIYARKNELYSPNDRFLLTFDVLLRKGGYDSRVEVGAYFPYSGMDRTYFNAVRDERCSNGLDMQEVIFYSQRLT